MGDLCRSADVTTDSTQVLRRHPCTLPRGHIGKCWSADGRTWVRVAEWRRRAVR